MFCINHCTSGINKTGGRLSSQTKMEEHSIPRLIRQISEARKKGSFHTWVIIILFSICLLGFIFIIYSFPKLTDKEKSIFYKWPRTAQDLSAIYLVISHYINSRYYTVMIAFCYLYIFLQAFGIPGPIILSLISGALFGGYLGFILVCFCATTGASLCYFLSSVVGKYLVLKAFPQLVLKMNQRIQENKDNLIYYLLFLRISPIVPNWLINVSSPIIGVPFIYFFLATLFGLMPANVLHVKAGLVVKEVESIEFNWKNFLLLFFLAFLALIPTLIKKKLKEQ
eukprot:TRINITY_DN3211_c0_g3_i1.p1 TRINITY_DN3211_c0_g3~~TRINITY_DN3211_c0_g3_i1.p1  ORF type:complete len:313 (-),score=83.18 TRINITY_DN3211_c0_g3_i1:953-1798(-)